MKDKVTEIICGIILLILVTGVIAFLLWFGFILGRKYEHKYMMNGGLGACPRDIICIVPLDGEISNLL